MHIDILRLEEAASADLRVPDVYYSAQYANSAQIVDSALWECAVADGGSCVYPYLRRPVAGSTGEYDVVSPYGYSGIIAPDSSKRRAFVEAFRNMSRERGLIAEFMRTNPFDVQDPDAAGLLVDSWRQHETYTVELFEGADSYWRSSEGRHRTAVRKASKHGVAVSRVPTHQLLDSRSDFRELYRSTMDRVGSSSRLILEDDYFESLVDQLQDHILLLVATADSQASAAAIFLLWGDRVHYHLSGATSEGLKVGSTNALIDFALRGFVPATGRMHLGGGVHHGDGLGRFKRSIANRTTATYLCRTVVNPMRYTDLVRASGVDPNTDYFPAYRGSA